jgi:hypothetical protein
MHEERWFSGATMIVVPGGFLSGRRTTALVGRIGSSMRMATQRWPAKTTSYFSHPKSRKWSALPLVEWLGQSSSINFFVDAYFFA